jgi:Resolvase, N terminal domain
MACDGDGLPVFERLRYRRQDARVFLYAFDLLELSGLDLRREPLELRKRELGKLLRNATFGLQLNEHVDDLPGDVADTRTPHGRLMLTVLGGLPEFERELIRARMVRAASVPRLVVFASAVRAS